MPLCQRETKRSFDDSLEQQPEPMTFLTLRKEPHSASEPWSEGPGRAQTQPDAPAWNTPQTGQMCAQVEDSFAQPSPRVVPVWTSLSGDKSRTTPFIAMCYAVILKSMMGGSMGFIFRTLTLGPQSTVNFFYVILNEATKLRLLRKFWIVTKTPHGK